MKLFKPLILAFLILLLVSCKSKPIEIVYETQIEDIATEQGATKIYILKKQTINSDFDYSKLDEIDDSYRSFAKSKKIITAFEPTSGKYNYYQFIATHKGASYNDGGPTLTKDFHDILIIKTSADDRIIDAYQYTLEWSEPPFQYDVFKLSAKNIQLLDNLKIENLKLMRTYSWDETQKFSNETGIIKLKKI